MHSHFLNQFVELGDWARDQSWHFLRTLNGESLTRPSLTISENTNIISVDGTLYQPLCFLEYLILRRFWTEYTIEIVVMAETALYWKGHFIIDIHAHLRLIDILFFSFWEWSHTAINSNITFQVFKVILKSLSFYLLIFQFIHKFIYSLLLRSFIFHESNFFVCCFD